MPILVDRRLGMPLPAPVLVMQLQLHQQPPGWCLSTRIVQQATRAHPDHCARPDQDGTVDLDAASNVNRPGREPATGLESVAALVEPDEAGPRSERGIQVRRGRSARPTLCLVSRAGCRGGHPPVPQAARLFMPTCLGACLLQFTAAWK
jgi:hypothetical protein